MTTFDKVYAAVRLIPRGSVATYGQIAAEAEANGEHLEEKPVTEAINEVAEGKFVANPVIEEDNI